ncbi:MAG: DNA repair protein RecO [Candidatus Omnitrophica bacterium]|nr:DNA repair protein RecO [Candidatus Omnitrophota bacterium]
MSIQKTEALVLRAFKFRETSLITTFLTADFGKIKAISKGVRKENSTALSQYEPFSHVRITFYEKTKSDIHFLSECYLVRYFTKLRQNFEKISWASYLVDLVDSVLPIQEKNSLPFSLLLESLQRMEECEPARLVPAFEIKLLADTGLFPSLESCLRCGRREAEGYLSLREGGLVCEACRNPGEDYGAVSRGLVKTIGFLAENDLAKCLQFKVSREMEEDIHRLVHRWIRYRLEKDLTTVHFLREVSLLQP